MTTGVRKWSISCNELPPGPRRLIISKELGFDVRLRGEIVSNSTASL